MLKTMRSNLKSLSWVLWIVILTFVGFIFVQWGAGGLNLGGDKNDLVTIGGKAITGEVFQTYLARSLDNYRAQMKENFNKSFIKQLGIPEQILQNLVNSTIIQSEADKLHLNVDDEELKKSIVNYPAFQREGRFIGVEEYERMLAYNQIKVSEFEEDLKKGLVADKLKELVAGGVAPETNRLQEEYRKENDKAEIEYISFKPESIKEETNPAENEIREYYGKNKESFKTPEKRAGYVLYFKFDRYKNEIKTSEKDLFDYYKTNKEMFKVPGKIKVRRILVKYDGKSREDVLKRVDGLANGIDKNNFADKAKAISEDEKAKEGGDWGYWGWQNFSNPEQTVIEKLVEGGISTPIDTGSGFSIVNVSEKVPEKQENYDAVKNQIRSTTEREKLKALAAKSAGQFYEKIKNETNLKIAAEKKGLKVTETPLVASGEPIKDIDEMGYLSQRFFSGQKDEITSPIELPDSLAILQLRTVMKPGWETFDQAKEKAKNEFIAQKKLDLLMTKAQNVYAQMEKLKGTKPLDEYLKKENLKFEKSEYKRGNRIAYMPVYKGLDDLVFSLNDGQLAQPIRHKTEIVLFKVISKKVTTDQDFSGQRQAFRKKKADELQNSLFASYLLKKRIDYKIRMNMPLYEKIRDSALSRYR